MRATTGAERGPSAGAGRRSSRAFAASLALLLAVGAGLRLCALGTHSFWYDEVNAMRMATAPSLAELSALLGSLDKVAAPLHPLFLRYWTAAWGTSEAASRGLTAAFSILGMAALAAAAWQASRSRRATLAATALIAVCPLDLAYAIEGRMYSMLAFWTTAAWALLFSFRRGRGPVREAAFGLCLVAMAYTHPLGGLMIIALALGYLIDARRSSLTPTRWLVVQAAAFAAILPWAGRYMDHPPDAKQAWESASSLFAWSAYGLGWPPAAMMAALVVVALAWFFPREGGDDRLRTGLMLACWVAVPLAMMLVYTAVGHPILGPLRYQVFLMPGLILLIAGAIAFRPLAAGGLAATLVLACTIPSLWTQVYDPQRKPDWRGAARAVARLSHDPVVVLSAREPHMYYGTVDYYFPMGTTILSLRAYRERLAAGGLDRAREYWLFRDRLDVRERGMPPQPPVASLPAPGLDFGRLTVSRLDPSAVAGLGPARR